MQGNDCPPESLNPVQNKISEFFHILSIKPRSRYRIKIGENIWITLNHCPVRRVLPPTLVRYVRKYLVKDEFISVLSMNWRFRQWRQKMKLWLGVVITKRIQQEVNCIFEVLLGFLGETRDQRDRRLELVLIVAPNHPNGIGKIKSFLDDCLHPTRSSLNSIEDTPTSRFGHQCYQFFIDTIRTGTAVPSKLFPSF